MSLDIYCLECEKNLAVLGSDLCHHCKFYEPRMVLIDVADHVSKAELKAWCEKMIKFPVSGSRTDFTSEDLAYVTNLVYRSIIDKFCKETV